MLLTVTFNSPTIRSLALAAAAKELGEDGWAVARGNVHDRPAERAYPATINCSEVADAVETWAGLFIAFARAYGAVLDPAETTVTYTEKEILT